MAPDPARNRHGVFPRHRPRHPSEELYDKAYAEEKLIGIAQLRAHVRPYSPEWAEKECEIPAADIRRIARELAAAAPAAMVYPGRRTSDYVNSTQIRRSMAIVNALLGNWDRPGGLLPARQVRPQGPGTARSPVLRRQPGEPDGSRQGAHDV